MRSRSIFHACVILGLLLVATKAEAQMIGIELHNTVTPASGGMGGASLSNPQDVISAINGNPATLTNFRGTQFSFGGAWIDASLSTTHTAGAPSIPGVSSFSDSSISQGILPGNIGVTQDFNFMNLPVTAGVGLVLSAGGGAGYRDIPESNGLDAMMMVIDIPISAGVQLTDRLSAGASMSLGTGIFSGPFVGVTTGAYDYALRGSLGLNYQVNCNTSIGVLYETQQNFNFDDAVRIQTDIGPITFAGTRDVPMSLPQNFGIGIANTSLMDGNLLIAADVMYKDWESADLFRTLYRNQWAFMLGTQLTKGRIKYRMGYAYATNPIEPNPSLVLGGITVPGGENAIHYAQNTVAVINPHRISAGIGIEDIIPGVNFDLNAGGMFKTTDDLGPRDRVSISTYWIGAGFTWVFDRGACAP